MPRRLVFLSLFVVACLLAVTAIYAFPHCVPPDKLSRIHPGLQAEDVVALLGSPISISHFSDGRSKLSYSKPFRYCTVDVFVDSTQHVTGVFHDH